MESIESDTAVKEFVDVIKIEQEKMNVWACDFPSLEDIVFANVVFQSTITIQPRQQSKRIAKDCSVATCTNKVRSKGLCKKHGGIAIVQADSKHCVDHHIGGKRCSFPGCNTCSVSGDYGGSQFCIRHGGGKKCKFFQCTNVIQSRGRCKAHGGGARCSVAGCTKSSQGRGKCASHGGGRRCDIQGCGKGAQAKGKCFLHRQRAGSPSREG